LLLLLLLLLCVETTVAAAVDIVISREVFCRRHGILCGGPVRARAGEGGLGLGGRTTGPRHTGGRTYGRPVYVIGFTATARAAAFSSRVCILFARIIFFFILYFLLLFVSFAYNDNSVTFSRTCTTRCACAAPERYNIYICINVVTVRRALVYIK